MMRAGDSARGWSRVRWGLDGWFLGLGRQVVRRCRELERLALCNLNMAARSQDRGTLNGYQGRLFFFRIERAPLVIVLGVYRLAHHGSPCLCSPGPRNPSPYLRSRIAGSGSLSSYPIRLH